MKKIQNKIWWIVGLLVIAGIITAVVWTQNAQPAYRNGGTLPGAEASAEIQAGL